MQRHHHSHTPSTLAEPPLARFHCSSPTQPQRPSCSRAAAVPEPSLTSSSNQQHPASAPQQTAAHRSTAQLHTHAGPTSAAAVAAGGHRHVAPASTGGTPPGAGPSCTLLSGRQASATHQLHAGPGARRQHAAHACVCAAESCEAQPAGGFPEAARVHARERHRHAQHAAHAEPLLVAAAAHLRPEHVEQRPGRAHLHAPHRGGRPAAVDPVQASSRLAVSSVRAARTCAQHHCSLGPARTAALRWCGGAILGRP